MLKSSLCYLKFLDSTPQRCCVAGLDYEMLCSSWDGPGSMSTKQGISAGVKAISGPGRGGGRAQGPELAGVGRVVVGALPLPQQTFRGDSRWLGLAKAADADMFAGYAASGNVFVAKFS